MQFQLTPHAAIETVGDRIMLLDSTSGEVVTLPAEGVVTIDAERGIIAIDDRHTDTIAFFLERNLGAPRRPGIDRRSVITASGAIAGGGLVALSLPMAAAASSTVLEEPVIVLEKRSAFYYWDFNTNRFDVYSFVAILRFSGNR